MERNGFYKIEAFFSMQFKVKREVNMQINRQRDC